MIYTSSYKNFKTELYKGVSISGDKGKSIGYNKSYYNKLAPKLSFWKKWHNNINKISEYENNKYYIKEYYLEVLKKLDPETIYKELDNTFLLCYEEGDTFCHRHIVSAWLELFLDIKVNETIVNNLKIDIVDKPNYIKETLENIIKENINMKGFTSLRALYLFNKSEELENEANIKEDKYKKSYNYLRQAAAYMRSEADMVEEEYNQKKLIKNKKRGFYE